jgi:hypothetical protein
MRTQQQVHGKLADRTLVRILFGVVVLQQRIDGRDTCCPSESSDDIRAQRVSHLASEFVRGEISGPQVAFFYENCISPTSQILKSGHLS